MSLTLTNQFLGLAVDPIDQKATSIINSVCGDSDLRIGDVVKLLPVGTGNGFTQPEDLLPRVGIVSNLGDSSYGIVVGGDFEGIYDNGAIPINPDNLALGIIASFFGEGVRVCTQGRCLALASGPISVGDKLTASPVGVINAVGGNIIATALQGTTEVNSIIAVDIKREGFVAGGGLLYYGALDSGFTPFIIRSCLDGTNSITLPTSTSSFNSSTYAVDSTSFYVANTSTDLVTKSNLDGTNETTLPISINVLRLGIDVDSTSIYVVDTDSVIKADLDGTNQVVLPITLIVNSNDIAVDSTSIYVLDQGLPRVIIKADLDGTNETTLSPPLTSPKNIAVDSTSIYVLNQSGPRAVIKTDLNGANASTLLFSGSGLISGLAVSSTSIYVGYFLSNNILEKTNLDGTNQVAVPVPSQVAGVFEIALFEIT